jgi:hypothetical protein
MFREAHFSYMCMCTCAETDSKLQVGVKFESKIECWDEEPMAHVYLCLYVCT